MTLSADQLDQISQRQKKALSAVNYGLYLDGFNGPTGVSAPEACDIASEALTDIETLLEEVDRLNEVIARMDWEVDVANSGSVAAQQELDRIRGDLEDIAESVGASTVVMQAVLDGSYERTAQ